MPRPERDLDPSGGPVEALAAGLRDLRREIGNPGYRVLAATAGYSAPTLANAAGGRHLPSLAVTLAYVRACGGDEDGWRGRWQQTAAELAAIAATEPVHDDAPYRGLASYGIDDADLFFGRERLVAELTGLLEQRPFLAVFGPSGSGKSSVLRAGLVPALNEHRSVVVTPGDEPLETIRQAGAQFTDDPGLLVVDQFEELFTHCSDTAVRTEFVTELAAVLDQDRLRRRVVLGVRADFFAQCAELPGLAGLLAGAAVPVGPLTPEELRTVITEPARRKGLSVERALVTTVVADAAGQPGALPLISHALRETWRQRRSDVLAVAGYEAAGGMAGAVARTAESIYTGLDTENQEVVRDVLTRLVSLGEGTPDTRRRVRRDELDRPGTGTVLQQLAAARLVVLDGDTVEIAHEVLIGAWPRLAGWLQADRDSLRRHRELTEAARIWQTHGQDPGALYRGARLSGWDGRDLDRLNTVERAFLDAGRALAATAEQTRRRRRVAVLISATVVVVVVSVLIGAAVRQSARTRLQRDLAVSRQLAAAAQDQLQLDQRLGLLLATQAYDTAATEEAMAVLRQAVVDSRLRANLPVGPGAALGVAVSADGRRLVGTGSGGAVRLWARTGPDQVPGQPRVLSGRRDDVRNPVFSVDGQWLAASGDDSTVTVWQTATGAATVLRGHRATVSDVAFSPDGQRVASVDLDGHLLIHDLAGGRPTALRTRGRPLALAFDPSGGDLAVGTAGTAGTAGTVELWDVPGGRLRRTLPGPAGSVRDVAFSADGRRLAGGGGDGDVRIWNAPDWASPLILPGAELAVRSVAFSPDGRQLAAGVSDGNTVVLWGVTSAEDPLVLRGHDGPVWSVAFSPEGDRLFSAGGDGVVRLWDPRYLAGPRTLTGSGAPVRAVVTRGGDRQIAVGAEDGTLHVWNPGAQRPVALRGPKDGVVGAALSPDGRLAAGAVYDGEVWIWNTSGPARPRRLLGHRSHVWNVAFSPDGRRLASSSSDGTVRIWDLVGRRPPLVLRGHDGPVVGLAFSPDGRSVASSGLDGTVRLQAGTAAGERAVVLRQPKPGLIFSIAFSPDGRRIAGSGDNGSLRIWTVDGRGESLELRGHQGFVWTVAFSPDGRLLASAGKDSTLRLWAADTGRQLVAYRGHRSLTETVGFVGDRQNLITGHRDGTIRIWRCEVCGPISEVRRLAGERAVTGTRSRR